LRDKNFRIIQLNGGEINFDEFIKIFQISGDLIVLFTIFVKSDALHMAENEIDHKAIVEF
jgi:hypothetical protein